MVVHCVVGQDGPLQQNKTKPKHAWTFSLSVAYQCCGHGHQERHEQRTAHPYAFANNGTMLMAGSTSTTATTCSTLGHDEDADEDDATEGHGCCRRLAFSCCFSLVMELQGAADGGD